ncbi:MAG: hypothetical protein KAS72_00460 [Phycisphaerales bacterium]|nr:hypothetical protein [Phycisphaerales bacterium]
MSNCTGTGIVLTGSFTHMSFQHCPDIEVDLDAVIKLWSATDSTFVDGRWWPTISRQAQFQKTAFRGTTVRMSPIMNRCDDRHSLDLQDAVVVDQWAKLRDNYTGPRLFIVLLLTLAFFAPYVTKSFFYLVTARLLEGTSVHDSTVPLAQVLFFRGHDLASVWNWAYFVFALVLLYYNVARLGITFRVAKLREREEHLLSCGFQKARPSDDKLSRLLFLDGIQRALFPFVAFTALARVAEMLVVPVIVFP